MKKSTILMLSLIVMIMATGCNKEGIKQSPGAEHIVKEYDNGIDYGSNERSVITDPVAEWGELISSTEATDRIADWITEFSTYSSEDDLSSANWDKLRDVEGAKGLGFGYDTLCELIVFTIDVNKDPIMTTVYKLNSSGGTELDSEETSDHLDSHINADTLTFPGITTLGFDVLDTIAGQEGFDGFRLYNVADDLGDGDWSIDVLARAIDDEASPFGTTGTTGAKNCRKWVPGAYVGSPTPIWQNGYWRDCTWSETMVWVVHH